MKVGGDQREGDGGARRCRSEVAIGLPNRRGEAGADHKAEVLVGILIVGARDPHAKGESRLCVHERRRAGDLAGCGVESHPRRE